MTMLMDVFITLPGKIDSKALREEVEAFKFNVTDSEVETCVHGRIDIRESTIEHVLQSCYKYSVNGQVQVNATRVNESSS